MSERAIVIVSGLPRSGTSMMMKMLEAGGMEVLTDQVREPDGDNPRGYYEFERVKQLENDTSWLWEAQGKVVKIISQLLRHLPARYFYRVVFMHRDMEEILASQRRMLIRRGEPTDKVQDAQLADLFNAHVERVEAWLAEQANFDVIHVSYNRVVEEPVEQAHRLAEFFDGSLDAEAMSAVVDPHLYRQRA